MVTNEIEVEAKVEEVEAAEKAMETFKVAPADGKCVLVEGVSEELITSNFWTKPFEQDHSIIMDENQIAEFNNEIIKKVPVVHRLEEYQLSLSNEELKKYITSYKIPTKPMVDSSGKVI
jgi:hypothetical protein